MVFMLSGIMIELKLLLYANAFAPISITGKPLYFVSITNLSADAEPMPVHTYAEPSAVRIFKTFCCFVILYGLFIRFAAGVSLLPRFSWFPLSFLQEYISIVKAKIKTTTNKSLSNLCFMFMYLSNL